LRASAGWRIAERWELGLELVGGAALGSAAFAVTGAASRQLATFDGAASLRLAWEGL
jgi:hypothetical protein